MNLLKKLCETPAIPGREQAIIDIMKVELKKSVKDIRVDSLGNVIGVKKCGKKNAPKIMLAGHMDEIGFIVSHIDKNGFIRFLPRGGHIPRVLISQRVKIIGKKTICGVVEGSSVFLNFDNKNKAPELKDMFIDTGLSEKKLNAMIEIGDPIVLDRGFVEQGDVFISKAFDDRIGCYIILEAMKKLKSSKKKLSVDVYAVGTTQEEVGLRGAIGAAKSIIPDIGIALDITSALDFPSSPDYQHVCKLGEGVAIKINDSNSISNHGIVNEFKKLGKKHKIKHQMEILPFGGTDARGMQLFGTGAVCTLSIPTRYAHSPNEMIHRKDVDAAINLLVKFVENAHLVKLEF